MNESLDEFFFAVSSDERYSLTVGSLMYFADPEDSRRRQLEETFEDAYLEEVRERNRDVPFLERSEIISRALGEIDRFLPRTVNALRRFYRERLDDVRLMPPSPQSAPARRQAAVFSSGSDTFDTSRSYGSDCNIDDEGYDPDTYMDEVSDGSEARERLKRRQTSQKPAQFTMKLRSAKRGFKEETDSDAELAPKRRRLATKPALKMKTGQTERKMDLDSTETSPEIRKKVVKQGRQELEYESDHSDDGVSEEAFRRLDERITDPRDQAKRFLKIVKQKSFLLPRPESSSSSESQGGSSARWNKAGFPLKRTSRRSRIDHYMDKEDMPQVRKFERGREVLEFAADDESNRPSTSGPYRIPVSDDDEPEARRQANQPSTSGPTQPEEDEDEEMASDH